MVLGFLGLLGKLVLLGKLSISRDITMADEATGEKTPYFSTVELQDHGFCFLWSWLESNQHLCIEEYTAK